MLRRHNNDISSNNIVVPSYKFTPIKYHTYVFVIVRYSDLQLPVQSLPISSIVMSTSPTHGDVYSIQHSIINCVSDL
jgi:hypothetical protein